MVIPAFIQANDKLAQEIKNLVKQYPNDYDLGKHVRKAVNEHHENETTYYANIKADSGSTASLEV
jgi:hypothetical protein